MNSEPGPSKSHGSTVLTAACVNSNLQAISVVVDTRLPQAPSKASNPQEAHLSSSVSMGTLFFSHVIRGLGSPWIWHWKRATPPSSPTMAWGCTWKSDMAGETDKGGVQIRWGAEGELRGHPLKGRVGLRQDSSLGDILALPQPSPAMGRHTPTPETT